MAKNRIEAIYESREKMRDSRAPSQEKIRELADQGRFNEIVSILDSESRVRDLELWHLVAKSRSIQLGEHGPLPLEEASEALQEALQRDPEYVPAMLDMAAYLDTYDDDAAAAIDLFKKAAEVVLDHLLDTIRGWAEAKTAGRRNAQGDAPFLQLLPAIFSLGWTGGGIPCPEGGMGG